MSAVFAGICVVVLAIALLPVAINGVLDLRRSDGYWGTLGTILWAFGLLVCVFLFVAGIALLGQGLQEVFA